MKDKKILMVVGISSVVLAVGACARRHGSATASDSSKIEKSSEKKGEVAKGTEATKGDPGETMTPSTADGVTVHDATACRAVQDRSPVDTGTQFPSDVGRIYVFSKVGMENGGKGSVRHIWYYDGKEVAAVTLPVEGTVWRTYSSKAVQTTQKGAWKVDIASGEGTIIKSVGFTIE